MKLRKILAVAMALTIVCGAETAFMAYQPIEGITANATVILMGYENEGVHYTIYNDDVEYAEVTFCPMDTAGDVTILSEINGIPVTSIKEKAFYSCKELTSITIPDSVTTIP